jgi:LPS-assembly lipoprotein
MIAKRRFVFVFAVTTALMMSGCGFQLRGSGTQSDLPFRTIHVALPETSSLGTDLRRSIGAGATTNAADPKTAEAVVEVLSETRNKEILSLNSQGRVRENALYYRVVFRVKDRKNSDFLAPTEIAIKRVISFNESQVLAKEMEEASLYRDMQRDMAWQILRRIAALTPTAR